jgi:gamma-glutamyltranspeptidase/glutathione hydrolase
MNKFKKLPASLLLLQFTICLILPAIPTRAAWREPVRGKHAMVASNHRLASQAGIDVIKRGGNAVDAAIAVALALAVVYPEAGNLGGGGFMLIRFKDGRTTSIDYREMAPAAAHKDLFIDEKGELIKGEGSSTIGYRASGVPGTPAGLEMAFKKYGSKKLTWAQLVEPARRLAANGYVLSFRLAELFKTYAKNLEQYEESKRIFLYEGTYYEEGDLFKQPDLAKTLMRLQRSGAKDFYQGVTAKLIADDMKAHNGLITLDDLKNYVARERAPVSGSYRGFPEKYGLGFGAKISRADRSAPAQLCRPYRIFGRSRFRKYPDRKIDRQTIRGNAAGQYRPEKGLDKQRDRPRRTFWKRTFRNHAFHRR